MTLDKLIEALEQATGPKFGLDAWVAFHATGQGSEVKPFTASIDAALTLVPEGWNWMAGNRNHPKSRAYVENGELAFTGAFAARNPERKWFECEASTPAIALCIAALKARKFTHG